MYGYDLSSRSAMLNRGRYSLMRCCFKDEGVRFRRHHDCLEVRDLVDEVPGLRAFVVILPEVAPDAGSQPLRLANVKDVSVPAVPEVNSGAIRQVREPRCDTFGDCTHTE